jgi:LuxR family maltose regulon positive regulatory protein
MEGRLRDAYAACHDAIQLAESSNSPLELPTLSHVYSTLSFVYCEWNDLEDALRYAEEAVKLAHHWEQADALHFALDNLGYILFASGDVEGAFDTLHKAWQVAHRTSAWFEEISISQEIEWHLAQDNLEAALERLRLSRIDLDELSIFSYGSVKSQLTPLAIIQIYIAQKQYTKALNLIQSFLELMEIRKVGYFIVRTLTLQAVAFRGLKQDAQALVAIKRALTLAAPEGYVRTFLKMGPELLSLLRQAREVNINSDYIDMLLTEFEAEYKNKSVKAVTRSGLVEPLSEREMDVLRLLAQGYTDKKIAESLVIARETVHKHLKNIYGKMDVHSRTEAVARARELNLL